jgi:GNAT superfamily N-acetyltransferase
VTELSYKGYVLSDDKTRIDPKAVADYLAKSYWAADRPPETVRKSIENSMCFGVYQGDEQVGFARVVTDYATLYYLADVYILEEHRGQGLAKKLVETITGLKELQGLSGLLGTRDAHGLYEQFGFTQREGIYMKRQPQ